MRSSVGAPPPDTQTLCKSALCVLRTGLQKTYLLTNSGDLVVAVREVCCMLFWFKVDNYLLATEQDEGVVVVVVVVVVEQDEGVMVVVVE